jgi:hypothetical protein
MGKYYVKRSAKTSVCFRDIANKKWPYFDSNVRIGSTFHILLLISIVICYKIIYSAQIGYASLLFYRECRFNWTSQVDSSSTVHHTCHLSNKSFRFFLFLPLQNDDY